MTALDWFRTVAATLGDDDLVVPSNVTHSKILLQRLTERRQSYQPIAPTSTLST